MMVTMLGGDVMETAKQEMPRAFRNVGELVDHLVKLGRDRALIFDYDGDTDNVHPDDVTIWNEHDDESPVAIFTYRS